jgi:general secretion pathway protein D
MWKIITIIGFVAILSSCAEIEPKPFEPSAGHIDTQEQPVGEIPIPELVEQVPVLPEPAAPVELEKYTVVVNEVPAKELLFALARDAQINVDINPGIDGVVTINAVEQTLPQILDRIARQVDLRYEFERDNLFIMPDDPFFHTYKVDYTNITRDTDIENTISTEIASTAAGGATEGAGGGDNKSSTSVISKSRNNFWGTLVANVFSILGEESTSSGQGQIARSTSILPSPESGLLMVKATSSQHEQIQQLIDLALTSARRQVLIQTTIVEVQLNKDYEAGIDWETIDLTSAGLSLAVNTLTGGAGTAIGAVGLAVGAISGTTGGVALYEDADASGRSINATIQLLDEFGNVSVLSSPQLMALNSHTAVLKVVNNEVYFTVESSVSSSIAGDTSFQTSTPHVIPVGIFMSITPFIDGSDQVILQIRPTISRLFGAGVEDPLNPGNIVPEVQVREMESMLRLSNGQIGVLGGLMQDESRDDKSQLPGTGNVPFFRRVFGSTAKEYSKSELVIFIRPIIIRDPSIAGDLSDYRRYLEPPGESVVPTAGL